MKPEHSRAFSVASFSDREPTISSTALDRWALGRIQAFVPKARLRLALWDGFSLVPRTGPAVGTITVKNRRTLWSWIRDPELNFGESYMSGSAEVHGDLVSVLAEVYRALPRAAHTPAWWRAVNDLRTSKKNVHHHYDLGNEFYRLWLDQDMVYTCAYFPTPEASLEAAQSAKMDLVCRKLRLKAGERVVEAGCGWGSLALFMARRYGVTVRAFNISSEQLAYARDRARRKGLDHLVEFVEDDYRGIRGGYDVFVSVGMLEHVGLPSYAALGEVIHRAISPEGRGLLHFIGRNQPSPLNAWIRKRIFPGAYPPVLREVFERVLEPHSFSVLDVENLRLHYAKTLEHWRTRFEGASETLSAMFDAAFLRAWRLYLAGSEASFITGSMQLFQVVFARGDSNAIPWTRVSG